MRLHLPRFYYIAMIAILASNYFISAGHEEEIDEAPRGCPRVCCECSKVVKAGLVFGGLAFMTLAPTPRELAQENEAARRNRPFWVDASDPVLAMVAPSGWQGARTDSLAGNSSSPLDDPSSPILFSPPLEPEEGTDKHKETKTGAKTPHTAQGWWEIYQLILGNHPSY